MAKLGPRFYNYSTAIDILAAPTLLTSCAQVVKRVSATRLIINMVILYPLQTVPESGTLTEVEIATEAVTPLVTTGHDLPIGAEEETHQ